MKRKSILATVALATMLATPAFAAIPLCQTPALSGSYSIHLDGTQRHGAAVLDFEEGAVTGYWLNHVGGGDPACYATVSGIETAGPFAGSELLTLTVDNLVGFHACLAKPLSIELVIVPFNNDRGFNLDATKPNGLVQSGVATTIDSIISG
jgi:hypothetical protein